MRGDLAVRSEDILTTRSVWRTRVRQWAALTLILSVTCAAWFLAQREDKRLLCTTAVPETDSLQRPAPVWQTAPASSAHTVAPAFVLGGVLSDDDPNLGYAMIGLRGGSVGLYKVGDQIQHGARLHAVYPDHVLLELNSTIQTLGLAGNVSIATPSPRTPSSTAMSGYLGRQAEVSAPGLLRDAMQYSELHTGGRLRAIRVSPGRDVQALQRLGLRPGDLIIAVNGKPVEEQSSGERALELLGNQPEGQITIVRNGSRQDVVILHAEAPDAPLGR